MTILDVACGSGDLGPDLRRWGERHDVAVNVVGLDRHAETSRVAAERGERVVRGDALQLPCGDGSFDFATCGMFLHHLDAADIDAVLRELTRVTRRGWIVADLLHRRRAAAWIRLFTLFSDDMTRHDARASVHHALPPADARELATRHDADYGETFAHRFLLSKTSTTKSPAHESRQVGPLH